MVALQGEVHFPNIEFEKTSVDFGCILNDTEVTRYVNMTNCSPMEVKYHWSFLIDDEAVTVYQKLPSPVHQHKVATEDMMDSAELAAELEETIQADLAAEDNIPPGWAMGSANKVRLRFAVFFFFSLLGLEHLVSIIPMFFILVVVLSVLLSCLFV